MVLQAQHLIQYTNYSKNLLFAPINKLLFLRNWYRNIKIETMFVPTNKLVTIETDSFFDVKNSSVVKDQ